MPTYEYTCPCGHRWEKLHLGTSPFATPHCTCGTKGTRIPGHRYRDPKGQVQEASNG